MTQLRGWTRPRPIRIVFLIEDGEHSALALDGIFADCYARWGGRYNLIVPCVNQQIPTAYWAWLEHFDPDVIYSYFGLSEDAVLEIHERLGPSEIYTRQVRGELRLDLFGFKPSYGFQPLKSLSGIFRLARYRAGPDRPLRIVDSWHTERASRFLTDNFGSYYHSEGTGMYPSDATGAADRLAIVSPENQANRQLVPRDLTVVPSELEAFRAIGERRATCMSLLSAYFAPKLNFYFGQWSGTFNLVVGDSFADRLLFWNARLLIPEWLDNNICCLRIDPAQLEDADFVATLIHLLNHHNHINAGAGGQSQLAIRSCSLDAERLTAIAEKLRQAKVWSAISTQVVQSPDAVIPDGAALAAAREGNRFTGDVFPDSGWKSFVWTAPTARPPTDEPDHLAEAPVRQHFATGFWATDFSLELDSPSYRTENRWMLPRRWRMAGAFDFETDGQEAHHRPPRARTSRFGRLTAFLNTAHPISSIKVPTIRSAFAYALVVDGHGAAAMKAQGEIVPPAKAAWLNEGNEDSYLTGVLGLAGGLEGATSYLLHPFLRNLFGELGGAPNPAGHPLEWTDTRLKKWVNRQKPYDLNKPDDRDALSSLIVRAASDLKRPKSFVSFDSLKKKWNEYRAAYWQQHPQHQGGVGHEEWEERDRRSLDACLATLRDRQLLFQGHRWICARCSHHNWQDFNDLSAGLVCSVCKQEKRAPVDIQWLFRANEFLIECLSQHSTLSLVWLLDNLSQRARESFAYVGPTWFGYTRDYAKKDSEADLMAIIDGVAFLCEAKSSWRDLRGADIDTFENFALRLRPDVAMLAVMQAGDGPLDRLAQLRGNLQAAGIKYELVVPRPFDVNAHPYLPHEVD